MSNIQTINFNNQQLLTVEKDEVNHPALNGGAWSRKTTS